MKAYELRWANMNNYNTGVILRGCYSDCIGWSRNNFCTIGADEDPKNYKFYIQHPDGEIENVYGVRVVKDC